MIEIYKQCTIQGNNIYLPNIKLERKEYLEIKTTFSKNGGKWVGGRVQAFVFTTPPNAILERLQKGDSVNLKKEYQEFFTPRALCRIVIELAEIRENDRILEPSAGGGNMIKEIVSIHPYIRKVDYCEIQDRNVFLLQRISQGNFVANDFITLPVQEQTTYDVIVANPPFKRNQDIIHLQKMWQHLSEVGRVVCITSVGWMTNNAKVCRDFRTWIGFDANLDAKEVLSSEDKDFFYSTEEFDVLLRLNNQDAFRESMANVRTVIIKINKPRR